MVQFYILQSLIIGFVIVSYFIPKIIYISNEKKLFDIPNKRSANKKITPHLGGIAIFAGFYVSLIVTLNSFDIRIVSGLLLASVVMFLIGLKDDLMGLSARKKLFFQLFTALYLVFMGGVKISNLHGLLGIYEIDGTSRSLLTLVEIVGITNAYNLIDGIDGLAAGTGILISIVYGALFTLSGQMEYGIVSFSLTGSLIAFFFYNVFGKANKIFMGDTGSLLLGIVFAFLTIKFLDQPGHSQAQLFGSPAIALSIMIVPIVDTIRVMIIRMAQKRSPFSPDMNHIHHQMIRITGNNHLHATLIIMATNLSFIAFACGFIHPLGNNWLFFILLAGGFSLAYLPVWVNRQNKKLKLDKKDSDIKVISINRETDFQEKGRNEKMRW